MSRPVSSDQAAAPSAGSGAAGRNPRHSAADQDRPASGHPRHSAPAGPPPVDQLNQRQRWQAFSVCLVAAFMTLLDVSIVNVAVPTIRTGLGASQTQLQWIVSGYALAFGLVLVPAGRLGDLWSRKSTFIVSLSLFTVASAGAGLAPSAGALVGARLVQGVAGGMLNPQVSGFVQNLFQGESRGRAFGIQGSTIGLSTAVGPLVGGALITLFGTQYGWRAVFFVNVPIGLVAVVLAWRLLPAGLASGRRQSLDPVGVLLLGAGVLLLLLPLVDSGSNGFSTLWPLFPVAVVVLTGFVLWERRHAARGKEPMLDLTLLQRSSFAFGVTLGLTYFAGFTALFFIYALFLQSGLGYSALASGLAITPFAGGSAVASFLAGRWVNRLGRPMVTGGLLLVAVGLLVTATVIARVPTGDIPWAAALPLLLAGLGSGAVISPNVTLTLSEVPVEQAGVAGGALQTFQRIGAAIGIAVVGAVLFASVGTSGGSGGGRPDPTRWVDAVVNALHVCTGLVALAFVLALLDVIRGRRRAKAD